MVRFRLRTFSSGTQELGNYETAFDSPRDANAWTNLSAAAYRCRQWDQSLLAAQRAFELDSTQPQHLYNLSLILGEFRRFKRARRLMERVVALDPQSPKYRYAWPQVMNAWPTLPDGIG
jgi:tetratricopeptide (TPR) repeat protein